MFGYPVPASEPKIAVTAPHFDLIMSIGFQDKCSSHSFPLPIFSIKKQNMSPMNGFESIPFQRVSIADQFWSKRVDTTHKNTLPTILNHLKRTGRWDVFRLTWKPGDPNSPH